MPPEGFLPAVAVNAGSATTPATIATANGAARSPGGHRRFSQRAAANTATPTTLAAPAEVVTADLRIGVPPSIVRAG
jgi:hypothetical protein